MSEMRLSSLHIYPIKSCGAINLDQANVVANGLEHDRIFMLVDESGAAITQRNKRIGPMLSQVSVALQTFNDAPEKTTDDQNTMGERYTGQLAGKHNGIFDISIKDYGEIALSAFVSGTEPVEAIIHGKPVKGLPAGQKYDDFFGGYLGQAVRLLRISQDHPRAISDPQQRKGASNQTGFADAYSFLLTTEASLQQLSTIVDPEEFPDGIPMHRFRPNAVVSGHEMEAYEEDRWRHIIIGRMGAHIIKPCVRCEIPDINQDNGQVGKSVRRALAASRKGYITDTPAKTGTFFGQNLNHVYRLGDRLSVGDTVRVLEADEQPNVTVTVG